MHFYNSNSSIDSVSGFSTFNVSGMTDYVIGTGGIGNITYTVHVGSSNIANASIGSVTNYAQFYYTSQNVTQEDHPGIEVSISPALQYESFNNNYTIDVMLNVSAGAPTGTYWVDLSPGPCFGGPVFLLTIGSAPYSGMLRTYVFH